MRAVIASAFPREREETKAVLSALGCEEICLCAGGIAALNEVRKRVTDVLIADAVLPGLDGAALAQRVVDAPLDVCPAIVILSEAGMRVRALPDGCERIDRARQANELASALNRMRPEARPVPSAWKTRIYDLLISLGVPEHAGRSYLCRAGSIARWDARVLRSMRNRIYPAIAAEYAVDARHVERSIRHVIELAWRSGCAEAQYERFGDTIDAKRGSPSPGEMIARIADILRWEGRA